MGAFSSAKSAQDTKGTAAAKQAGAKESAAKQDSLIKYLRNEIDEASEAELQIVHYPQRSWLLVKAGWRRSGCSDPPSATCWCRPGSSCTAAPAPSL